MSTEDKQRDASGNPRVFAAALVQFCFSSVGMMIGNKMAMDYLRDHETNVGLPSTLVGMQVVGTLLILCFFRHRIDRDKLNWRCVRAWAPIFTLFAGMLFTSAKTFQYVHVSFVIIVRNVGAIVTTIVEYIVRGSTVNEAILCAELTIVFGTCLYGRETAGHFKDFWAGVFWCLVNVLCQVLYGVTLKHAMDTHPDIGGMSKYTMSLYNNLLCLPYFVVAALSSEVVHWKMILPNVSVAGWGTIAATCAIGFMISTSGFGLQKLVSATTFIIINNMCKILNIILGVLFLGDLLPGWLSCVGCAISLGGGFWYTWETQKLNERKKREARDAAGKHPEKSPMALPGASAGPAAAQRAAAQAV